MQNDGSNNSLLTLVANTLTRHPGYSSLPTEDKKMLARIEASVINAIENGVEFDEEELLKESFTLVRRRLKKIPKDARANFIDRLSGMLMVIADFNARPHTIRPVAVPEGWEMVPGRPRKIAS